MTAKDPFDLKVISDVLRIGYDTLRRWVRDCILKIDSAEVQGELHGMDFKTPRVCGTGGTIGVPVFRPEAVGPHMAVDEKYIKREFYTILTNTDTGRIAMMCRSLPALKPRKLQEQSQRISQRASALQSVDVTY